MSIEDFMFPETITYLTKKTKKGRFLLGVFLVFAFIKQTTFWVPLMAFLYT